MKKNRFTNTKKIILILILILLIGFCFTQRELLKNEIKAFTFQDHDTVKTEKIAVDGSHVIEQPLVFHTDEIGSIRVLFDNPGRSTAKGNVTIELIDNNGRSLGKSSLEAGYIKENRYTNFLLGKDSKDLNTSRIVKESGRGAKLGTTKVEKGEEHTLRITTENISSDEPFSIVVCKGSAAEGVGEVSIDGKVEKDRCVYMSTKYMVYSARAIILLILMILAVAVIVLLPYDRIDRRVAEGLGRPDFLLSTWISRLFFIMTPLAAYLIIQKYAGFGLGRLASQLLTDIRGPLNLIIIGLLWWVIYTICNRVRSTAVITVFIASLFGFVNYLLALFRDFQLMASDFAQLGTAMQVAGQYTVTISKPFLLAVVLTVLWCVTVLALPGHKGLTLRHRLIPVVVLIAWVGMFYYVFFASSIIEDNRITVSGFKPGEQYYNNGSALSFVVTIQTSMIEKPNDYSVDTVEQIAGRYPSDKAGVAKGVTGKTPNVIVVMNESFTDLSVLGDIETNKDFMPYYRSLKENTIKGWLESSVYGGATANSEFEFQTSFTTAFMPFHSFPFRSFVKGELPTITRDLEAMGYGGNIAFHPGMRSSYNRENVYPLLGFEEHIAIEDLKDPHKIRDFVSDSYDYECVEKEYEKYRKTSDKPFYMFNVTIQNHGGYSYDTGIVDEGIEIKTNSLADPTAIQFLNLMKLSDDALKELIEYYSKVDEETVIVLYGDHQPRLAPEFYSAVKEQQKGITDMEWTKRIYRVPFLIWANYDIEEKEDVVMSINYLGPYLKNVIGMPRTGFDKYLSELQETLPVISAMCHIDPEGNVYDPSQKSSFDKVLNEYSIIQYNGLIDRKNSVDGFFELKQ